MSRSKRIRHRNELTVKAWEKAVQELGNMLPRNAECSTALNGALHDVV